MWQFSNRRRLSPDDRQIRGCYQSRFPEPWRVKTKGSPRDMKRFRPKILGSFQEGLAIPYRTGGDVTMTQGQNSRMIGAA